MKVNNVLKKYTFSQTSLKHFEDGCPRKWEGMWINKIIPFYSNDMMDKGKYLEYLCIGGSAKEDDEITDLPRKKNGEKYVDQIRIESHAKYFKEHLFNPDSPKFLGYKIISTQKVLWSKDKKERGVLDIEAEEISSGNKVIIDTKLTKDLTAVRHKMNWGHQDKDIETTQAETYCSLYKENYNVIPEFVNLVFDLSPQERRKKFAITIEDENFKDLKRRKDELFFAVANKKTWEPIASSLECQSCPLKCGSRVKEFKYKDNDF